MSDIFVSYAHKVHVWVSHALEILIGSNHEVFPVFLESVWGVGKEIIGKQDIRRKGGF